MKDRVCCYITSADNFFSRMALTSITMLRQYNKEIKVRIFVIGANKPTLMDELAEPLHVEVLHRPAASAAKDQNYFCLNRCYLGECHESSVLYIDGDTFIFGDVASLFDRYKDVDFAAAEDRYIISTQDWSVEDYQESCKILSIEEPPVFNGGLTLWNNGSIKKWTEDLTDMCNKLQNKDLPISKWLFGEQRQCYHRETFSICFAVAKNCMTYNIMDRHDVVNLFSWPDFHAFKKRDFIVYHSFTQNWERFHRELVTKKKSVI